MRIVASIFLLIILTSCSDFEKKEQLEKISSLNEKIDEVEKALKEGLIEDLDEVQLKLDEIEGVITNCSDTITLEQAKLIDHYKVVRLNLDPYNDLVHFLDTNILLSRSTLNLLETDIKGAQGRRQDYDKYISHESAKVDSLQSQSEELIIIKSTILESLEICYPAIIDELEASNDSGIDIDV